MANREVQAWAKVDALIAKKLPKDYDEAVVLLVDLAGQSGWLSKADSRLRELRQQHAKKPAFVKRLDDKKLGI